MSKRRNMVADPYVWQVVPLYTSGDGDQSPGRLVGGEIVPYMPEGYGECLTMRCPRGEPHNDCLVGTAKPVRWPGGTDQTLRQAQAHFETVNKRASTDKQVR